MSFDDTNCPCGGKKERETLICQPCIEHIKSTTDGYELKQYENIENSLEHRRGMAIRLLSMSRRRMLKLPLTFPDL